MMRKNPWTLAACVLGAAVFAVSAVQAQEVASNIVGYVKVDVTQGQITLLSTPFNQVDGSANTVANVIGDQAATGSSVFTYNGASYDSATNLPVIGWSPGDLALPRGTGFWLDPGANGTLLLMGEVPEDATQLDLVAGDNLVGTPVPVEMTLTTSGLAAAPAGTSAFFWDGSGYQSATSLPVIGWSPDSALQIGEGFWVSLGADFSWTEPAP